MHVNEDALRKLLHDWHNAELKIIYERSTDFDTDIPAQHAKFMARHKDFGLFVGEA